MKVLSIGRHDPKRESSEGLLTRTEHAPREGTDLRQLSFLFFFWVGTSRVVSKHRVETHTHNPPGHLNKRRLVLRGTVYTGFIIVVMMIIS